MKVSVNITDAYEPTGESLTPSQYVNFVMNMAAKSYMSQYKTNTVDEGVDAACQAYNDSLPPKAEVAIEVEIAK